MFRCEGAAKDREAAAEHSRIESTHRTPEAARSHRELACPESAANRPAVPVKHAEAQANDVEAQAADVEG